MEEEKKAAITDGVENEDKGDDNQENTGENENVSGKKGLMIAMVVVIFVLVVLVGVFIGRVTSEEEVAELDDSFCAEFGVSDSTARSLIRSNSRLSETLNAAGETIVTLELDRTRFPALRQLTCLPSEAFVNSLFNSGTVEGITLKNCPVDVIHPNAFAFDRNDEITVVELVNLPFADLPEDLLAPLISLEKLSLDEGRFESLSENILGDVQVLELNLLNNLLLGELPAFLKEQNELQTVSIVSANIIQLEEEQFGSVSNLESFFLRNPAFDLVILENSEIAAKLGVRDEVVDTSDRPITVCRDRDGNIFAETDNGARDILRDDVDIDVENEIVFFKTNLSSSGIDCFPPNTFATLFPEQREQFLSFTTGSLIFEGDLLRLHPDTFKEDIYAGFTSLTFIEYFLTDQLVDNIFEKFVNIEHFEVFDVSTGDANAFAADIFGENCNLKSVKMEQPFQLRQLPIFVSGCPNIEVIDVSGSGELRFLDPKTVENLSSLQKIILTGTEVTLTHSIEEIAEILKVDVDIIEI